MNSKNSCTIYLVRHGQTELQHIKFDAIFSSDLLRTAQTAEIIALEHRLLVETPKALRGRRFGKLEGQSHEELKINE